MESMYALSWYHCETSPGIDDLKLLHEHQKQRCRGIVAGQEGIGNAQA